MYKIIRGEHGDMVKDISTKKIAGGVVAVVVVLFSLAFLLGCGGNPISNTTWYGVAEEDDGWVIETLAFGEDTVVASGDQVYTFELSDDFIRISGSGGLDTFVQEPVNGEGALVIFGEDISMLGLLTRYYSSREAAQAHIDALIAEKEAIAEAEMTAKLELLEQYRDEIFLLLAGTYEVDTRWLAEFNQRNNVPYLRNDSALTLTDSQLDFTFERTRITGSPLTSHRDDNLLFGNSEGQRFGGATGGWVSFTPDSIGLPFTESTSVGYEAQIYIDGDLISLSDQAALENALREIPIEDVERRFSLEHNVGGVLLLDNGDRARFTLHRYNDGVSLTLSEVWTEEGQSRTVRRVGDMVPVLYESGSSWVRFTD